MILIIGTIRIPLEQRAAALPAMRAMAQASRAEDGCLHYAYAEDLLEPGLVRVSEMWRDQLALDRHFASPHLAEWRAQWPGIGITDRNLMAYGVGDPRPI